MSNAIAALKPEPFWRAFIEIARIPRPSGHEEEIGCFILGRAKELQLFAQKDAFGNIVVRKPASPGREGQGSICLQCHTDMVCEKNADKVHDFLHDPIELLQQGDMVTANGTTLGADNGAGVATALALMADNGLSHGPLEFLFTVEEETGLTGARNLDPSLVKSRTLLNLDSEEEGAVYVGCAGGKDTQGSWQLQREPAPADTVPLVVTVKGLKGGHSGLDIDKGLGNAIKLLNRALLKLSGLGARLAAIDGGNMRNAIPRECRAVVYLAQQSLAEAQSLVDELNATFRAELTPLEPEVSLSVTRQQGEHEGQVFVPQLEEKICRTIAALPSGVQRMSADIAGLVETSTNVAVITTSHDQVALMTSQRSSVASRLEEVVGTVEAIFELGGAAIERSAGYPGWKPDLASPILKVAREAYRALFGKEVEVKAIHAGLECGIIGERVPGMDMISFGPTLESVHSPDEKIYIDTVDKYWKFLLEILKTAG
jgi:dipeptidase D